VTQAGLLEGRLKPLIDEALFGDAFGPSINQYGWIRVSGVATICPRAAVLVELHNIVQSEPISSDLALVLEHGNAIHWVLQNHILPKTSTLFGRWTCMSCGHSFGGVGAFWDTDKIKADPNSFVNSQVSRPEACPKCGKGLDEDSCIYREQHLKDKHFKLSGHPDGFLVIPGMSGMGIFEAKSISPRGAWEVRGTPKMDHAVQVQCYLWMTGLKWGKILYWDKGGFGLSALVEHTVERDEGTIRSIQEMIRAIHKGLHAGPIPDRVCSNRTCDRASACPVVNICFGDVK